VRATLLDLLCDPMGGATLIALTMQPEATTSLTDTELRAAVARSAG